MSRRGRLVALGRDRALGLHVVSLGRRRGLDVLEQRRVVVLLALQAIDGGRAEPLVAVAVGAAARRHRRDQLLAVDAMNDPRSYMIGKRLLEMGRSADPAIIADASRDLKPLLR